MTAYIYEVNISNRPQTETKEEIKVFFDTLNDINITLKARDMLVIWQYTDNNSKNKNNTNKLNLPFKGVPYCFNDNDVKILNSGIEANISQGTKNQTTYNIIGLGQSITKNYIINRYGNELKNIKGRPEKNILTPGGLIYNTGNGAVNK